MEEPIEQSIDDEVRNAVRRIPALVNMWCHWRIWCNTMPSTNPPRPMPSHTPGASSSRVVTAGPAAPGRSYRLAIGGAWRPS